VNDVLYTKVVLEMAADRGMDQQAFREAMNVSSGVMTNWKRRKTIPPERHVQVARVLKCGLDELLGRAPPAVPKDWPFPGLHPTRLYDLSPGQRLRLQEFVIDKIVEFEAEKRLKPPPPSRFPKPRAASG
jgi:hypothetical protein